MLDLKRVYAYLGTGRWFRRVAQNGSVAIGGIYYYINPKYRGRAIEVTFDPERALSAGTWQVCQRLLTSSRAD